MPNVNLTATSEAERYGVRSVRWTGNQGWIGNDVFLTTTIDRRPVRAIQTYMKAFNAVIPTTLTNGIVYVQYQTNGQWHFCGRYEQVTDVALATGGLTLAQIRNASTYKAIDAAGMVLHALPMYGISVASPLVGEPAPPIVCDAIRLLAQGNGLAQSASVAITTGAVAGASVGGLVTITCASATHGLVTGDCIDITVSTGAVRPAAWSGMVGTCVPVVRTGADEFTFTMSSAYSDMGTSTTFTYKVGWNWTALGLDIIYG
jgi:hypothetical protein